MARQERATRDRRPIFSLLGAEAVSQVGNSMTVMAAAWFVLETTGSAAKVGLVSAALGVGAVVPAVLGGPLVDRLGFKRASVLADAASAATVAAVPLLYLAGVLAFWHLVVLAFLLSSLNAQGDTARYALIPALARRAAMPMERANAVDRAIGRMGQLVGPPVAGVLIALMGAANVLFVDAATFSISAALVAVGVVSVATGSARVEPEGKRGYLSDLAHGVPPAASSDAKTEAGEGKRGYFSQLVEGLRFVRTNRLLLSMILIATVGNFIDIPLISVVLPVYAKTFFGSPESLGVVLGAFGAGALGGTLLFGAVGRNWPRRLTFLACYATGPVVIFGTLAATPPLGVLVAAAAVAGLIFGPINPLYTTVIQEKTPPQMLGRTFGALIALALAGIPLGSALAGSVVEVAGIVPTIVGMGAIYLAVTLGMFLNPALRQMDAVRSNDSNTRSRSSPGPPAPPSVKDGADRTIRLRDGRRLGYAEWGDPGGRPLLYFHGWPGSRVEGRLGDEAARERGIRFIAIDRPGMGLSDFQPRRTFVDWPDDVVQVAAALGLDRFAVLGISGGGPYAAACAWELSDRLTGAGIVSSLAPLDVPGVTDGMGRRNRVSLQLVGRLGVLRRVLMARVAASVRRRPDRILDSGVEAAVDKEYLARPEVRKVLGESLSEAFRSGSRGAAWEMGLYARPWGFRLEDIRTPVYLSHGEEDANAPVTMGRYLASSIPECRASFYSGEGHLHFIDRLPEILGALGPRSAG